MSEAIEKGRTQIQIKILFFATLKDQIGSRKMVVELPERTRVADLRAWLAGQYPQAAGLIPSALAAINHEFANDEDVLPDQAEVAFFPPVSGGGDPDDTLFPTIFFITAESLDLNELLEQITLPTTGAACLFSGMVRASTERGGHLETAYLEYESYRDMAETKMAQVADEIRQRWPAVEGIVIVQRIGRLLPGTPTVLIGCSAAHRDTGVFEAARYGIDRLKQIVPIWKKEVGPDGTSWVEGSYQPRPGE